jgi:peroxiredoxin
VAQRSEKVLDYLRANSLPFEILLDEGREVTKRYGVWHRIGLDAWNIARPALFIIDRDGVVRYIYVGRTQDEFADPDEISRALDMTGVRVRL